MILSINLNLFYILIAYAIFILFFFLYIFSPKKNKYFNNYETISIIKDKEFMLFKIYLDKLYFTSSIILFYFIFYTKGLNYLFEFNLIFNLFLLFIFIFYSILLSDSFKLNLFKIYLEIKNLIKNLNEINFLSSYKIRNVNIKNLFNSYSHSYYQKSRTYSTLTNNHETDTEVNDSEHSLVREQAIKKFKQTYGSGYLGYNYLNSFGSVSYLINSEGSFYIENFIKTLEPKFKAYLNGIPENVTYSILPILRRENADGDYKSISISKSIKITRDTSCKLLAKRITHSLLAALLKYSIQDKDIELLIAGRPWLDADDFNVEFSEVTKIMDRQIEKEISSSSPSLLVSNNTYSEKAFKLKIYEYSDIYMDDYGDPVLDKNKNLIGYRINESEHISLKTEFNYNNQLCNKVSIKEFDEISLTFKNKIINSWVDIRTEFGFIREYNDKKYYYDKSNILTNVEVSYNCSQFPVNKKDTKLDEKIGAIDFETFGSNLGLGYHEVFAGGWTIGKNNTQLLYRSEYQPSVEIVSDLFKSIFLNKLDGYTFYVHNLGRFDSIFIIKALTLDKNFIVKPIWKDNAILSITIKYLNMEITILDSLQLISGALSNILDSFNCKTKKGHFPYSFVNSSNLFYVGDKPAKIYYKNIPDSEYLAIPTKNWVMEIETLKYFKIGHWRSFWGYH
jgi:hypothetical protein